MDVLCFAFEKRAIHAATVPIHCTGKVDACYDKSSVFGPNVCWLTGLFAEENYQNIIGISLVFYSTIRDIPSPWKCLLEL